MAILFELEDVSSGINYYEEEIPAGERSAIQGKIKGQESVVCVVVPVDDLGGRVYCTSVEEVEIALTANGGDLSEDFPPEKDIIKDLPIGGKFDQLIELASGLILKIKVQHYGQIILLCHPNTKRPILSDLPIIIDDNWDCDLSEYSNN